MSEKYLSLGCILIIIFVILMMSEYASAKCPTETYRIKGSVLTNEKNPLSDVVVSAFFDDSESGYSGVSSVDGQFQIEYIFQAYKGHSFFGDRCGKKPSKVMLMVYRNGYFPKRIVFRFKDLIMRDGSNTVEIPPIILINMTWEQKR